MGSGAAKTGNLSGFDRQRILLVGIMIITAAAVLSLIAGGRHASQDLVRTSELREDVDAAYLAMREANVRRTLTTTLAVETGRREWISVYDAADEALQQAVRQAIEITGADELTRLATEAELARSVLVTFEHVAMARALRGYRDEAAALLKDSYYLDAESTFEVVIFDMVETSKVISDRETARAMKTLETVKWAGLVTFVIIIALWGLVLTFIARDRQKLALTKAKLEKAHASLKRGARLREASFFQDSIIAMFENDMSKLPVLFEDLRAKGVTDIEVWLEDHVDVMHDFLRTLPLTGVNEAALDLFGLSKPEDLFTHRDTLFRDRFWAGFAGMLGGFYRGETQFEGESIVYTAQGDRRYVMIYSRLARGAEKDFSSVITSLVDITARKTNERQLAKARDAAEAASVAKSRFLATMSHEIRTPLNGVLGMAAALGMDALTSLQRQKLDVIEASGQSLLVLLNDILDLSKVEAGQMALEMREFDLADVVKTPIELHREKARAKGLGWITEICQLGQKTFRGDPMRLRQVFSNLLSNAVKFTEAGTISTTISVEEGHPSETSIVEICVRDTGIGISSEAQKRLFNRFMQADDTMTRKYGGSGLGLAICHELVTLMGGTIAVESELGEGTTFTVRVPLETVDMCLLSNKPAECLVSVPHADESHRPLRILAAEDNANNQEVLRALLGALGAELTVSENGREAVEAYACDHFDLVLMDIQMPVMDGLEAFDAIRAFERKQGRPETPVIALTANAMAHHVAEYNARGFTAHVAKPVTPTSLLEAIAAALSPDEALPEAPGNATAA